METNMLLEAYLKQLRLPTVLQNYRKFADDSARANRSYDHYLLALLEQEVAQREKNRQQRRIKAARFPALKDLATFDFSAVPDLNKVRVLDLARGEYIVKREPILMVGNPGVGKTHVATGLAAAACRQGYKVRFYNAAGLVNDMIQAQDEHRLTRLLNATLKHQLIVLDELGFIPFTPTGAQLIFQFCSALYEQVALIVTTNLRFADWTQVFGNERLTAALLDRLTHRAHILEFIGESYRFRQRMQQDAPHASQP
ncbi:MAG: IS21-like element helper ATPase IstB [Bacteroidales bacterium]|nr:IS21-like element helper ATPase IstB [Bacteroidales bacterium]